jgi:surface carbohydrate biosynthesis protein
VRELDAKLLFSLVAAERGYRVLLGARATLHFEAASLPRGVYVAKSVRALSTRMFRIYRDLGCEIVSWDEESLVRHPNPEFWYRRRIAKEALDCVRAFLAWGEADAEAVRAFPGGCTPPVYATGNPRLDLTRRELRSYFASEADAHRERHGDFILVNTNFGLVNHYVDSLSGVVPLPPGQHSGSERAIGEDLVAYRTEMFERFKTMVPAIAKAFPDHTILVRPHPVEKPDEWEAIAARHANVVVEQAGNVLPWLLAARALVHSGCTTGIEAYALGVPAIAYEPIPNERFESGLPNDLSRRAQTLDALEREIASVLRGQASDGETGCAGLAARHMASLVGPLACDRIVDVLDALYPTGAQLPPPAIHRYLAGWIHCEGRAVYKRLRALAPGNRNSAAYQRHRFPGVDVDSLRASAARFSALLGRFEGLEFTRRADDIFELAAAVAPSRRNLGRTYPSEDNAT